MEELIDVLDENGIKTGETIYSAKKKCPSLRVFPTCEYKVYKNTLVRKAFDEIGVTDFDNDLNGATAFVFCPDETSGCSIIAKSVKENPALEEKIVPKSAYVGGAYVDAAGVKKLAAIPSREVLIAKMLGCLQAPIANLAYVLNAIAGQKS